MNRLLKLMLVALLVAAPEPSAASPTAFVATHCVDCHAGSGAKAGLKLDQLKFEFGTDEEARHWANIYDRVRAGEMPPKKRDQPADKDRDAFLATLKAGLEKADRDRLAADGAAPVRRMSRVEFENTLKDLLGLPGLKVQQDLPADGKAHGYDRSAEALDFSFVHQAAYLAAVDQALNEATPAFTEKPASQKYRYKPWDANRHEGREMEGATALLIDGKAAVPLVGLEVDPTFENLTRYKIKDDAPHATALGVFRHEDADFRFSLTAISPVVSGPHKIRVSGYSFRWDGTKPVKTDRTGAFGLGIHSTGEHYGTRGVPANEPGVAEWDTWLARGTEHVHGTDNYLRLIFASCGPVRHFDPKAKRLGPNHPCDAIAVEWIEIEGPNFEQWPPTCQTTLFGDLPVKEWTKESGLPKPTQQAWPRGKYSTFPKDPYGEGGRNRKPVHVVSVDPEKDARKLLAAFLPRAFRRPVADREVSDYLAKFQARMKAGDHFQDALKSAYRAALTSPDFLLLGGKNDSFALASRLSYFLWSGPPDRELVAAAEKGTLTQPDVLRKQTERLLTDPKAARFIADFTDQWLRLREIGNNPPDRHLYPEAMPWLQESMLNESRAYFAELLKNDIGAAQIVKSDFAMLNEPLARHYGIPEVRGFDVRRVALKSGSPRGGFPTQASVLKVTANGTTTSPVTRGAFIMERLLGIVPTPPPTDAGSIEPDTRGATTVREQLEKHKTNASCASCHVKMDPYGFALESFDVIGGQREKYRVRGPSVEYKHGPAVDSSGVLPDGRKFDDYHGLREMLATDDERLARAFVGHLTTYATGRPPRFADRPAVQAVLDRAKAKRYGLRTLLVESVLSPLFHKP